MPVSQFTPQQRFLSLTAVIAGALAVGVGIGALIPLIGLRLEAQGVDNWLIGATGGMVPLAILLFGPFVPRVIARLGTVPSLLASFVLFNVTVLLFPLFDWLPALMALRFLSGIAVAVHWVVTETWMNMMATDRNRGRVMAIYVTAISTGFACGPLVIAETGIAGARPFFFVIAAMALSMVPMVLARSVAPPMPIHASGTLWFSLRAAPIMMLTAFFGGMMDLAVITMLPLYGLAIGADETTANHLLSVFVAGNVVLQIPIGWLADKLGRIATMLICTGGSLAGAVLLPFLGEVGPLLWLLLFLWGGLLFAVYTVALGLLGDRFPPAHLAAANTVFVMVYNIGSFGGPVAAGAAMDLWSADGMAATIGIAAALLLAATLWRGTQERQRLR
jgi:MFS family permease